MGSPVDLTLGCSTQAPSSNGYHSDRIRRNGSACPGDYLESLRKGEEYLRSLEDERRKVEGFKRELPICIQLLENAIQTSKEMLANGKNMPVLQLTCRSMDSEKERNIDATDSRQTLDEFLPFNTNVPLKRRWDIDHQNGGSDGDTEGSLEPPRGSKRPAWMVEAQLLTQNSTSTEIRHEKETEQFEQEQSSVTSSQLRLSSKDRPTGAFLPFLREQPDASPPLVTRPMPVMVGSGAGLSLSFGQPSSSPNSNLKAGISDSEMGSIDGGLEARDAQIAKEKGMVSNGTSGAGSSTGGNQSQRKARRCWSPELHRRFVSALHQLGGPHIATPKQIRELMKVDGLTNDEIKSHLQKYRLHTRRPSPSSQSAAGAQSPQLVVLGGIWVPPKYTPAAQLSAGSYDPSTGNPPQPTQFYQSALPQNHYFACISNGTSGAPVQMHRQPIFEPQQSASQSQSSPQGPLQVTSQLSEATQGPNSEVYHDESGEEEAKSDSTSWKGRRSPERDSENGGIKVIAECFKGEEQKIQPDLNVQVAEDVQS